MRPSLVWGGACLFHQCGFRPTIQDMQFVEEQPLNCLQYTCLCLGVECYLVQGGLQPFTLGFGDQDCLETETVRRRIIILANMRKIPPKKRPTSKEKSWTISRGKTWNWPSMWVFLLYGHFNHWMWYLQYKGHEGETLPIWSYCMPSFFNYQVRSSSKNPLHLRTAWRPEPHILGLTLFCSCSGWIVQNHWPLPKIKLAHVKLS